MVRILASVFLLIVWMTCALLQTGPGGVATGATASSSAARQVDAFMRLRLSTASAPTTAVAMEAEVVVLNRTESPVVVESVRAKVTPRWRTKVGRPLVVGESATKYGIVDASNQNLRPSGFVTLVCSPLPLRPDPAALGADLADISAFVTVTWRDDRGETHVGVWAYMLSMPVVSGRAGNPE